MAELFLDPKGFEGQITEFEGTTGAIKGLKFNANKSGLRLQSVDKYLECVEAINKAIGIYAELLAKDAKTMKAIKATWMNADAEIASKTFWEHVTGK